MSENYVFRPEELLALDGDRFAIIRRLASGFTVPDIYLGTPVRERTRAVVVDHLAGTSEPDFDEFACVNGWHVELNVPLVVDDCADGALVIYRSADEQFTPAEVTLAESLGKQLALAMQANRLATESKLKAVETAIAREQEKAAQERAVELAKANDALGRSLNRLANNRNLNSFLGHVLQEALQMLDGAIAQFFIYDPEADTLMPSIAVDLHGEVLPTPGLMGNLPISEPFPATITKAWERMLNQRSPIYFDMLRDADDYWPGTLDWHRSMSHCGSICTALMIGDQPLGMLGLALQGRSDFTASEFEFFHALAQQATLAIQLTRLAEEAKRVAIAREQELAAQERAAELAKANESLRRSLRKLANERNLDAYLEHILREALQMLNGTIAQIFLYDSTTDTLTASVGVDQQGEFLPTPGLVSELPIAQPFPANLTGIWQRLLNHRGAIQLDLDRDAHDFWPGTIEWHRSRGNQAILCVPMLMGDMPLGLLGLASTECIEFTHSELEFTQALVQQATLAIQLTRLAEEAKHAAIYEERNRMASEIHDTLAQAFTGISLQLEVAKELVGQDPQTMQQILNHISQLAETGLTEARRSVWALYPPAAEYADLAQLLYDSVEQMTRNTTTTIEVNLQGTPCPLPPFIGMNLLRIGQEALTNALKHAQAQTIAIELVYESAHISLTIRDNGHGFIPPTDPLNGGFGLIGMYERCDRIGAQLSLTSQPGQGTQILVEAPLS
ncbi:GAF domain-containing protein [Leptolyngbya sp. FACHB-36]|nr:GAF domain-containing protein [Leptolyngbya sp. FACHB-36]